jgi:hypothetical protein
MSKLKIEDRNIPVRTRAKILEIFPRNYNRLGLRFGDTIKIPDSNTFPKKWRGERGIVVERYKSINIKPDGRIFCNPGVEVLFTSKNPRKNGKVRRFLSKLSINDRILKAEK